MAYGIRLQRMPFRKHDGQLTAEQLGHYWSKVNRNRLQLNTDMQGAIGSIAELWARLEDQLKLKNREHLWELLGHFYWTVFRTRSGKTVGDDRLTKQTWKAVT